MRDKLARDILWINMEYTHILYLMITADSQKRRRNCRKKRNQGRS